MRKYLILACSLLTMICLGGIYGWSLFVPDLIEAYNYNNTQMQSVYGITVLVFTFSMILLAGRFEFKFGPKITALVSGVLVTAGYIIASFAREHFLILLLGYAIINGLGIGFGYLAALSCCIRWFPKNKGLASGFVLSGYGGGAMVISLIGYEMLKYHQDVMIIFRMIGIFYGAVVILCAIALVNPADFKKQEKAKMPLKDFIKQRKFLFLLCGISAGTFPGLMIIGNLKPICLSFGFSIETATLAITFIAIGNAAGRIKWGGIYDKLQKKTIDLLLLSVIISTALILTKGLGSPYIILFLSFLVGLSYGGCLSVFAAHTANEFSEKYFSVIYPFILTAHGICAPFSSTIAGSIYDNYNSYQPAIIIASLVATIGLAAVIVIGRKLQTIEVGDGD